MEPFTTHTGRMLPLRSGNVDTDQIIPAVYLKRVTRTGFADGLFKEWRTDPDFVLNRPEHAGATVLVAGPDFGTGSSREHAVWALQDHGFRVVLSARFGDIFRSNALKGGLLTLEMDQQVVTRLLDLAEAEPATEVTVDLRSCELRTPYEVVGFRLDEYSRYRLLHGLDDIALTLGHVDAIEAYERARPSRLPTIEVAPS